MWWRQKPTFTNQDSEAICAQLHSQIEAFVGQPVHKTKKGLATHQHLLNELLSILQKHPEQTSPDLLASKMLVEQQIILDLLKELVDKNKTSAFVDHLVIPEPLIAKYQKDLNDYTDFPKSLNEYCSSHKITIKLLLYLVKGSSLSVVNDFLVPTEMLDQCEKDVLKDIEGLETPKNLFENHNSDLVKLVFYRKTDFQGHLDDESGEYTPKSYTRGKRSVAIDELNQNGYISLKRLEELGIGDKSRFAKKNLATCTREYVLSSEYIDSVDQTVQKSLSSKGYFDLTELELGQRIAFHLPCLARYKLVGNEVYILRNGFTKTIAEIVGRELSINLDTLQFEVKPTDSIESLKARISLPEKKTIEKEIYNYDPQFPKKLVVRMADEIGNGVRAKYMKDATKILEGRLENARLDQELKAATYLKALQFVKEPLVAPLFQLWRDYTAEKTGVHVESQSVANELYLKAHSQDELQNETQSLIEASRAKLKNTSNPAAVLHLAAIIWHATHFTDGAGFLKITGKFIPKLLQQYDFPKEYLALKSAVTSKTSSKELITSVKASVELA